MTKDTALGITGVTMWIALLGFIVVLATTWYRSGFWDAVGGGLIYLVCAVVVVGLIGVYCYINWLRSP